MSSKKKTGIPTILLNTFSIKKQKLKLQIRNPSPQLGSSQLYLEIKLPKAGFAVTFGKSLVPIRWSTGTTNLNAWFSFLLQNIDAMIFNKSVL